MQLNYIAIIIATVLQFIFGAIWYTPIFGNLWAKIHSTDKYTKEQKKELMKGVGKFFAIQFVITFITTFVFAIFMWSLPHDWNAYGLAFFFWIGFVVPTQISAVIFGETKREWMVKKILIMAGASFFCLQIAAIVLHLMS